MKKKTNFIIIALASAVTITSILLVANMLKKRRIMHQRQEVSDEGYEFAHDILFPLKSQQLRRTRQGYP